MEERNTGINFETGKAQFDPKKSEVSNVTDLSFNSPDIMLNGECPQNIL